MAEVNKEELRRLALEVLLPAYGSDPAQRAISQGFAECRFKEQCTAQVALSLLDENAAQAARIAELERECERLRKEVDTRIDQGRNSHEMLNNVLRENAELRGEVNAHRATESQEISHMRAELEACRKDAERYRWLCEKFGITKLPCAIERILEGDAYVADGKNGIDAAIDAAMQEGGV